MLFTKRVRILVIFISTTFLLIVFLGISSYNIARNQIISSQEKSIEELGNVVKTMTESLWIKPREKAVEFFASTDTLLSRIDKKSELKDLIKEWEPFYKSRGEIFYVYYADRTGFMEIYPQMQIPKEFNPLQRPWYIEGIGNPGKVGWSEPYIDAFSKESVISTFKSIEDPITKKNLGVFSIDFKLTELAELLKSITLPERGEIYVAYEDGTIIASTERNKEHIDFVKSIVKEQKIYSSYSSYFNLENEQDIFVNMNYIPSVNWKVIILVPGNVMLSKVKSIKTYSILVATFLLAVSCYLFYNALQSSKRKVAALVTYFTEIGKGSKEIKELFIEKDDFGILNGEFNSMIKEARKAEEERINSDKKYRKLVENAPIGIFQADNEGEIMNLNLKLAQIYGYSSVEEAMKCKKYVNLKKRKALFELLERDGFVQDFQLEERKKDGRSAWVAITARVKKDENDKIEVIDGFSTDVTEQIEAKERLQELADTDGLTKINNRRHFMELAQNELNRMLRYGGRLSIAIFDIDHFKKINDLYGHDIGDKVLKKITEKVLESIREMDILGRFGGDEFVLLLPQTGMIEAFKLGERIRKVILNENITLPSINSSEVSVTISMGISYVENAEVDLKTLIKQADMALYEAKKNGRNGVCCYEDKIGENQ